MRLAEMEYLLIHGGSRGHLLQYELLWTAAATARTCARLDRTGG